MASQSHEIQEGLPGHSKELPRCASATETTAKKRHKVARESPKAPKPDKKDSKGMTTILKTPNQSHEQPLCYICIWNLYIYIYMYTWVLHDLAMYIHVYIRLLQIYVVYMIHNTCIYTYVDICIYIYICIYTLNIHLCTPHRRSYMYAVPYGRYVRSTVRIGPGPGPTGPGPGPAGPGPGPGPNIYIYMSIYVPGSRA